VLYEFIKERVEHYKEIKIIIINPNPESIAALFEKELKELDRVTILPAYWNSLTRSIKTNKLILGNNSTSQILRDYYRFELTPIL
jgi:predicted Zn-dependent peptidase